MAYAIGLNSGSSFDGVDAVLIEIGTEANGSLVKPKFVQGLSIDWPVEIQRLVLKAFANELSIFELTRLNYSVGAVFAQAATTLIQAANLSANQIEVIGYDGQTIYQEPPDRLAMKNYDFDSEFFLRWTVGGFACGLQIGEPGVVAVLANVPTVTQFRSVDHALGGTGAPLMQFLDYVYFKELAPVATLNIGGISNLQVVNRDKGKMMAFDCGPGNVMIDHAMKKLFGKSYDAGGLIARTGTVHQDCLKELVAHPFFSRNIPRCAWRLDFGGEYADAVMAKYSQVSGPDLVATFTEFSAIAITKSLQDHVLPTHPIEELIASGGGTRNDTLLDLIRSKLPSDISLSLSDKHGLPSQFKEAVKFATLAFATINRVANNIPHASGASDFGVLGKLVIPPRMALP